MSAFKDTFISIRNGVNSLDENSNENKSLRIVEEWKRMLASFEISAQQNPEEYGNKLEQARKEYNDLAVKTREAFFNDQKITTNELNSLRLELSDIRNIDRSVANNVVNRRRSEMESIENKEDELKNKKIDDYTPSELKDILKYTQRDFGDGKWNKIYNVYSIAEINWNANRNHFQEWVIEKVLGNDEWFNDTVFTVFDQTTWYNLMNISNFEKHISKDNIHQISDETLNNYLRATKDRTNNIDIQSLVEGDKEFRNITIGAYTIEEAKQALKYSQRDFWGTPWRSIMGILTNKLNEITNNSQRNAFQDGIAKKILDTDKWFNDEFIQGYDAKNKWWNHIVAVEDFEWDLKNKSIKNWDSFAVANYFTKESDSLDIPRLIKLIGIEKILELQNIWKSPSADQWIAKDILSQKENTKWIVEWVENIKAEDLIQQDPDIFAAITKAWEGKIDPTDIVLATKGTDFISRYKNEDVTNGNKLEKEIIVETRKVDFEEKFKVHQKTFIENLWPRFWNNQSIIGIFEDAIQIEFNDNGEIKKIDWSEVIKQVNLAIDKHNENTKWEKIQRISPEKQDIFIAHLNKINEINLQIEYTKTLGGLNIILWKLQGNLTPQEREEIVEKAIIEAGKIDEINSKKKESTEINKIPKQEEEQETTTKSVSLADTIREWFQKWENPQEIVEAMIQQDDQKYSDGTYVEALEDLDNSYVEVMKSSYWEDWKDIVPNPPEEIDDNIDWEEEEESGEEERICISDVFDHGNGSFSIQTLDGEVVNNLSEDEARIASKSEIGLKRILNIRNILTEINMPFLNNNPTQKTQIFTAISNLRPEFKPDDYGYIDENETKVLLTALAVSIAPELWPAHQTSIHTLKTAWSAEIAINEFKKINGAAWMLSTEDANLKWWPNLHWDSLVTSLFLEKFMPRDWIQILDQEKFEKSLLGQHDSQNPNLKNENTDLTA